MTTYADLLRDVVARAPGRPLVTFYDEATGERVELSTTTYANWVAKLAGLLQDELDLERGMTLRVDLPAHWLGPVFLGAAWSVGLVVDDTAEPDAVVCGPDGLDHWALHAAQRPVLACALLPLGVRFADPLPAGVHDVGIEVWSQPDAFAAIDPPLPVDVAVRSGSDERTHAELWRTAAAGSLLTDGGRLVSTANPASPPELAAWTEPLARGGSLVLVVHADRSRLDEIALAERASDRFLTR